jgi:oligopeptide/dipeptide ABC transporter ATP-binding protein
MRMLCGNTFREMSLLTVQNLKVHYPVRGGVFHSTKAWCKAVDGVSLSLEPGETLGLVGESGCGKSTVAKAVVRLLKPTAGQVVFEGHDITHSGQGALRTLRRQMQMVFQDPAESLNPRHTVGQILEEPFLIQKLGARSDRTEWVDDLLRRVGLPPDAVHRYPFEFSGGQRQRIGIARALALKPKLIVCDEPVSALDVSVQAQIVNLFMDLQDKLGLTYVFIAHDLSVVRQIATRTAVMYLGSIVELGETDRVLHRPAHPYTAALISAVPEPDPHGNIKARTILRGEPPSPTNPPPGCRFHTRCPIAQDVCKTEIPRLRPLGDNRSVACHFPLEGSAAGHA